MQKKMKKRYVYSCLLLAVLILCLSPIFHPTSQEAAEKLPAGVEITKFENKLPNFKSSYYLDVYNDHSDKQLMADYTILVDKSDEPISVEFAQVGTSADVLMQVYLDFDPIEFRIGDGDYKKESIFRVKDGYKIKMPVRLQTGTVLSDHKRHKLFVTFTSIPEQHISDYDKTTNYYGINAVYDITSELVPEYGKSVDELSTLSMIPSENFEESFGDLVLNTDYDNQEYSSNRGILVPEPRISAKAGESLPLMYNMDKHGCSEALLVVTVDYSINGMALVALDGTEGTANGRINVTAPDNPGLYEVIAYAIYDPRSAITESNHLAENSYRLTLSVDCGVVEIEKLESENFTIKGESVFFGEEKAAHCPAEEVHDGNNYYINRMDRTYIREDNQYYIDNGYEKTAVYGLPEDMAGIKEMVDRKSEISNLSFASDLALCTYF